MIYAVRANKSSFRTVEFRPGFNIVIADRTETSLDKESRNGLGKSTLLEIIHFCLGSNFQNNRLVVAPLSGWEFILDIRLGNNNVTVTRKVDEPGRVIIEGNTKGWPIQPEQEDLFSLPSLSIRDWNSVLGVLMFGLPLKDDSKKYKPTFRSLLSYFIRRGRDAFVNPFLHHNRKQQEWDKQVNINFLLSLDWESATDWQILKEKKKLLDELKKANKEGLIEGVFGTPGELEAEKVRLGLIARQEEKNLKSFRIHPQYQELEQRLNRLTEEIHQANNENFSDRRLLELYQTSIKEEQEPELAEVTRVYEEAGIELSGMVQKRLQEVHNFHKQIVQNRRQFLFSEIERLQRDMSSREESKRRLDVERSALLEILQTHGALEEYTKLQQLYLETITRIKDLDARIERLRQFQEGISNLKIEQELSQQRMRRNLQERRFQRDRGIELFNSNSQFLYEAPGTLIIDVNQSGYEYRVDIKRDGSNGIDNMKIFCFDLMLAQIWSEHNPSPQILIHDSTIFADVDERQKARAIILAERESRERGFQYICTYNSDNLPNNDLKKEGFDLEPFVRLRLTDTDETGSLLGIRF